jgi:hypothetical protein
MGANLIAQELLEFLGVASLIAIEVRGILGSDGTERQATKIGLVWHHPELLWPTEPGIGGW